MNKEQKIFLAVFGVLLFGGIAVGSLAVGASNMSFMDKVAQSTGQFLAENLGVKIGDNIALTEVAKEEVLGASAGPKHYDDTHFFEKGLVAGGVYATTTEKRQTAVALTVNNIKDATLIDVMLGYADGTLTFPASTSLTSILPEVGDTRTWIIRNSTTTDTAIDLAIASSTGVIIMNNKAGYASNIVNNALFPGKSTAHVTLTHILNGDFVGTVNISQ